MNHSSKLTKPKRRLLKSLIYIARSVRSIGDNGDLVGESSLGALSPPPLGSDAISRLIGLELSYLFGGVGKKYPKRAGHNLDPN